MKIGGYLKTSLIDWPGKIASVIFIPGCNFRCPFCHNSGLVDPRKIKKIRPFLEKQIFEDFKKRKKWLDGVVLTGGEPLFQPDLEKLLRKIKQLGFKIKLDTNGSLPDKLQPLLAQKLIDYVALDIKTTLDDQYSKAIGLKKYDPLPVKKTLNLLLKSRIPFELRTTIVPGIHDLEKLKKMAKQLKKIVSKKKINWFWQNFQPKNCLEPQFEKIKPYLQADLEGFLKTVERFYLGVKLRAA